MIHHGHLFDPDPHSLVAVADLDAGPDHAAAGSGAGADDDLADINAALAADSAGSGSDGRPRTGSTASPAAEHSPITRGRVSPSVSGDVSSASKSLTGS